MKKSFHPSGSPGISAKAKALDMFAINHGSIDGGGGGNALSSEFGLSINIAIVAAGLFGAS